MLAIIFALSLVYIASSERLHDQIYSPIDGASACFRRLNGTHQAGCSSTREDGAVGAVQWLWTAEDARWVAGGGGGGGPYVAVVSTLLFNQLSDILIARPDNIAGVIVYENSSAVPEYFSDESPCPNEYSSGPESQCESTGPLAWNPQGSGLLRRDIPLPVFYLPASRQDQVDQLLHCYQRFNEYDREHHAGRPLCSVQLSAFMFAAVNTRVCLRRSSSALSPQTRQCDPLGDKNIYFSLFPRSKNVKETNRSVILMTARIDSASLFDGLSPGAASSVVGLVTFLTAAKTLSVMLPHDQASNYSKNVLWLLLSGESFDYTGSQRVAYDMSRGEWPPEAPLSPATVALHAEVAQLGGGLGAEGWPITIFAPHYDTPEDEEIRTFITLLQQAESKIAITAELTSNLPPSSVHSFRRELGDSPARGGLPELVIADHGRSFTNHYYQSALDDNTNVKFVYANVTVDGSGNFLDTDTMISQGHLSDNSSQVKISRLAGAIARALYTKVTGDYYTGNYSASAHMVDELLYCYLSSAACRMFVASHPGPSEDSSEPHLSPEPYHMYTSVHAHDTNVTIATGALLALLTGRERLVGKKECLEDKYTSHWCYGWNNTGICVTSSVNYTDALSPAFIIEDYDWASGVYSTWSESVWRGLWARVFVAPSGRGAAVAAALGAAATLLAAALTYWLQRHAHVIFSQQALTTAADLDGGPRTC